MHRCAATCCDNRELSVEKVQSCVEKCSSPMHAAQTYVQGELEQLQNRLQHCVMDCNDDIKLKMGRDPSQSDVNLTVIFLNIIISLFFVD